jgi:hypothetical protein
MATRFISIPPVWRTAAVQARVSRPLLDTLHDLHEKRHEIEMALSVLGSFDVDVFKVQKFPLNIGASQLP